MKTVYVILALIIIAALGFYIAYYFPPPVITGSSCSLVPDPGPCKAAIPKYYFDTADGSCKQFIYGGCEGIVPFDTLSGCMETCGTDKFQIPFLSNFGTKIVYTTDTSIEPTPFRNNCERRGGTFNECGTTCEPGAEFCTDVCALTCENIGVLERFIGLMRQGVVNKSGQPIEGFEPFMFIDAFPGLVPEDFEGVAAAGGAYFAENGEVVYDASQKPQVTSADFAITNDGMAMLLKNIGTRLGIPTNDEESVDRIVSLILSPNIPTVL